METRRPEGVLGLRGTLFVWPEMDREGRERTLRRDLLEGRAPAPYRAKHPQVPETSLRCSYEQEDHHSIPERHTEGSPTVLGDRGRRREKRGSLPTDHDGRGCRRAHIS